MSDRCLCCGHPESLRTYIIWLFCCGQWQNKNDTEWQNKNDTEWQYKSDTEWQTKMVQSGSIKVIQNGKQK